MNKYFDGAIVLTTICSVGLITMSIAESKIYTPSNNLAQDTQLEKLDNSLTVKINNLKNPHPQVATNQPPEIQSLAVSPIAIDLVKEFEGFESQAYIDTDGTPVIGYGLSAVAGSPVQMGDRISSQEAERALVAWLQNIKQQLNETVKVKLSDRQLSALASLSFNVGINAVKNSTLVKKLNAGDYLGAANEFLRWDKANVRGRLVQLPGLTRRRQAERQLFLEQIQ